MNLSTMKIGEIKAAVQLAEAGQWPELAVELAADARPGVQKLAMQLEKRLSARQAELKRLDELGRIEGECRQEGYNWVCGTDEVGRGPLAGPVVAAAVILPAATQLWGINDSKKLSAKARAELDEQIKSQAVAWAIAEISPRIIDAVNILQASRLAMVEAVRKLDKPVDLVLVDGLFNPLFELPQQAIVKGDSKCLCISAASVIAKVYRDNLMDELDKCYPGYGLAKHKGYPTKEHYEALRRLGPSEIHRISFDLKLE